MWDPFHQAQTLKIVRCASSTIRLFFFCLLCILWHNEGVIDVWTLWTLKVVGSCLIWKAPNFYLNSLKPPFISSFESVALHFYPHSMCTEALCVIIGSHCTPKLETKVWKSKQTVDVNGKIIFKEYLLKWNIKTRIDIQYNHRTFS